jgi:hypothetical protein
MTLAPITFFRSYAQSSYDCALCADEHEAHTPIVSHIAHQRATDGTVVSHQFCLKIFRELCLVAKANQERIHQRRLQNHDIRIVCPICRQSTAIANGIFIDNPMIMHSSLLERETLRIKSHEIRLVDMSPDLRNEYDIALAGVEENGFDLSLLSRENQNNKNIVLAAISKKPQSGTAIAFASDALKDDEDIALIAINNDPLALEYISSRLQNHRTIVEAAVSKNGETLKYASHNMKNDKDVVLKAVTQSKTAFKYASFQMRTDEDILQAFKRHSQALFLPPQESTIDMAEQIDPLIVKNEILDIFFKNSFNQINPDCFFTTKIEKEIHLFTISKFITK